MHDVFVSYASCDRDRVEPIVDALRRAGATVWFDASDIAMFTADITAKIAQGIDGSAITLAFLSGEYEKRQACKWELLRTIQVGQFDDLKLVLLDGPHSRLAFVKNLHFFDLTAGDANALVAKVLTARQAASPRANSQPRAGFVTNAFTGRFDERIDLIAKMGTHLADRGSDSQVLRLAQITGLGGQGKTMLARQYATDRALAYADPLLLDAGGDRGRDDDPTPPMDRLLGAVLDWLQSLGAQDLPDRADRFAWRKVKEAVRRVQSDERPFLWIVDDLPSGLTAADIDNLACPAPGHTLVTTRTGTYDPIISGDLTLRLGPMSEEDAVYLLAGGDESLMRDHGPALTAIAEDVGFHGLAMGVLGPRLRTQRPDELLVSLRRSARDEMQELRIAAQLVGGLPSGHEASILVTLQDSIDAVHLPAARQILTLASMWPAGTAMPTRMLHAVIQGRDSDGIQELVTANLATMQGYESLRVHAILAKVVAWLALDDDPQPTDWLRQAAAAWLAHQVDDPAEDAWDQAEAGTLTWHLLEPIVDRLEPVDAMRAFRALMAMARLPMRYKPAHLHGAALVAHLREALGWARRAHDLVRGEDREAGLSRGRALAMQGLLSLDIAFRDDATALNVTLEALDLLDESWAIRAPLLIGPEDLDERTKAQFNFGRAYLKLGQVRGRRGEFDEVSQALDAAMRWYGSTAQDRLVLLARAPGTDRPTKLRDLASCYRGHATVCLQRALLTAEWTTAQRRDSLQQGWVYLTTSRERVHEALLLCAGKPVLADMAKDMQVAANLAMLGLVLDLMDAGASVSACRGELASRLRDRPAATQPWDDCAPVDASVALARLDAHAAGSGRSCLEAFLLSEMDQFERTLGATP